ncbi:hypothetical protein QQ045_019211 [Rhodiola kirilowii]
MAATDQARKSGLPPRFSKVDKGKGQAHGAGGGIQAGLAKEVPAGVTLGARSSAPDAAKAGEQQGEVESKEQRSRCGEGREQQGKVESMSRNFWAKKTSYYRNRERGVPLQFHPQFQRVDSIVIPAKIWNEATTRFKFALVGFVFGSKPYLGRIKGFARSKWGDDSVVRVSQLSEGIFLLNFTTEEKMLEAQMGGPWTFDNRPFILKQWSEAEEYKCGSISALPVWVRLPRIKAHLADARILSLLCSRLGKPICTDDITADGLNYNYVRVCIEVYADAELLNSIEYQDPYGNKFVQPVLYEWEPPRCNNCCNFGHTVDKCPEPNLEKMIEMMREQEMRSLKLKDKTDLNDNGIERVTQEVRQHGTGEETYDLCSIVSDTQAEIEKGDKEEVNIEEGGVLKDPKVREALVEEFKEFMSKSALKRARRKERRNSGEGGSREGTDKAESSSGSGAWNEGTKTKTKMSKSQKIEKQRKEGGNTTYSR